MDDNADAIFEDSVTSLQRTGGDHEDAHTSHGSAPYSRIRAPTISHCLK